MMSDTSFMYIGKGRVWTITNDIDNMSLTKVIMDYGYSLIAIVVQVVMVPMVISMNVTNRFTQRDPNFFVKVRKTYSKPPNLHYLHSSKHFL